MLPFLLPYNARTLNGGRIGVGPGLHIVLRPRYDSNTVGRYYDEEREAEERRQRRRDAEELQRLREAEERRQRRRDAEELQRLREAGGTSTLRWCHCDQTCFCTSICFCTIIIRWSFHRTWCSSLQFIFVFFKWRTLSVLQWYRGKLFLWFMVSLHSR
jgi:hypothetical protein